MALPLVLLLVLLVALPALSRGGQINYHSRQYLFALVEGEFQPGHLEEHPRRPFWLALWNIQSGNAHSAITTLETEAAARSNFALGITAVAHEAAGNHDIAVRIWQQQGNPVALLRIAERAEADGELATAEEAYRALWQIEPVQGTLRFARFLQQQRQDLKAAEAVLRHSIDAYPLSRGYPYWLKLLAANLVEQEHWADAVPVYEQWLLSISRMYEDDRKPQRIYTDLAWALYMSGQESRAVATMEEALALKSEPYVLRIAGELYEAAGNKEEAAAIYRRWLGLEPDSRAAAEALERLAGN